MEAGDDDNVALNQTVVDAIGEAPEQEAPSIAVNDRPGLAVNVDPLKGSLNRVKKLIAQALALSLVPR